MPEVNDDADNVRILPESDPTTMTEIDAENGPGHEPPSENLTRAQKFRKYVTLEPGIFLTTFGLGMTMIIGQVSFSRGKNIGTKAK